MMSVQWKKYICQLEYEFVVKAEPDTKISNREIRRWILDIGD